MNIRIRSIVFLALVPMMTMAAADEDSPSRGALLERIAALEARVAALEAARSFTRFMPDYAERFHVMHRAGDADDWPVAAHELAEIQRLTSLAPDIDAEKGQLMNTMMKPVLAALEEAVSHGDAQRFGQALTQAVNTCNACHDAAGSPFIDVTLDASDSLSMRHPHRLQAREPREHHHGEAGGGMSGQSMGMGGHHDEEDHHEAGDGDG